jgi:hypothetical protein
LNNETGGLSKLQKPTKLYLNNTNLMFILKNDKMNIGTLREIFIANQLKYKHKISLPPKGDFLIDNTYTIEIGGKEKSFKQIENIENSYVVADDIEIGLGNKIPLWLFGFLY